MPDGQVIACPTCAKKFKLPERPPATFTCTSCQTVMDLSAFQSQVAAAAPAAPAESAGVGTSRRAGSGSRPGGGAGRAERTARAGGARTGGARTRSRRGQEEEEDDGGRGAPPEKKSMALVWGSLVGLVAIVGIAILAMSSGKGDAAKEGDKKPAEAGAPSADPAGSPTAAVPGTTVPGAAMTDSTAPSTEPAMDTPPPTGFVPFGRIEIHAVDHHPEATDAEKHKIDELINVAIFQNSGADGKRAQAELVTMGVKAAPRLINVFYTVKNAEGFTGREGNSKAQIADAVLRKIDGHIERRGSPRITPIRFSSDEKHVIGIVKRWLSWWDNKLYLDPRKPWDEKVDGERNDAPDKPADGVPAMQ